MFLSKILSSAEAEYWPTELEVACLIWIMRKIRHMVEGAHKPMIVLTDHSSLVDIVRQTKLSTSSAEKLNLRLVRASNYLSQYNMKIRHKPGKLNIVPDALSRLAQLGTERPQEDVLGDIETGAYHSTIIEISPELRKRLIDAYESDPFWFKLAISLKNGTPPGIQFELRDKLLYFYGGKTDRLYIPKALRKLVFELVHDNNSHSGLHRCFQKIIDTLYILRLTHHLREYIRYCPACLRN